MKRWIIATGRSCLLAVLICMAHQPTRAAEPFFFIQLSDPQFGMFTGDRDFLQETANFEFAVANVNRLRPAFVVITGDLVNKPGDPAQIAEYLRIVGKIDASIPVHNVAGNHDVENVPTPSALLTYSHQFGADRYTFRHDGLMGIVLNSSVIHSPEQATNELAEQERWLRKALALATVMKPRHLVIFQHHPWFLKTANEPDEYFNIPAKRRSTYLDLFHQAGVKYLFSGHYHRNAIARDGELEAITTGPVGMPLGSDKSGFRVVIVRENKLEHRYYHFGEVPNRIDLGTNKVLKATTK